MIRRGFRTGVDEGGAMSEYTIRPLGPDTCAAFARLAERHNGVWNGCLTTD